MTGSRSSARRVDWYSVMTRKKSGTVGWYSTLNRGITLLANSEPSEARSSVA